MNKSVVSVAPPASIRLIASCKHNILLLDSIFDWVRTADAAAAIAAAIAAASASSLASADASADANYAAASQSN